jgi:hypothetical protein
VTLELPGVPARATAETEAFWKAGQAGELVIEQCVDCGLHVFPPRGVCRSCHGRELRLVPVRPPGVVYSMTVNRNAWYPDGPAEFPLVLVEFPGYSGARFVGRWVGEDPPDFGSEVGFRLIPALGDRFQIVFGPLDGES